MKKYIFTLLLFLIITHFVNAEEEDKDKFFKAPPLLPGVEEVAEIDGKWEYKIKLSHDELLTFYKEEFKDSKDIKYRDWDKATYIEDDGARKWHSITISKETGDQGTTVIIAKDSWTWIMGTLILRYIAVFVVLLILFVGMKASGFLIRFFESIFTKIFNRTEAKKA